MAKKPNKSQPQQPPTKQPVKQPPTQPSPPVPQPTNIPPPTQLPIGAFNTFNEYTTHLKSLLHLEYGLQSYLSPSNSFSIEWAISEHLLTQQINLIATIKIPHNILLPFSPSTIKLGSIIQLLHPTDPLFNVQNIIPIIGFVDSINTDDSNFTTIDIIINSTSTSFLRDPTTTPISTLLRTTSTNNNTLILSPHASTTPPTPTTVNLSKSDFRTIFSSIPLPETNCQIIIRSQQSINYLRLLYTLSTMQLAPHITQALLGQYQPVDNPLDLIGFLPESIPTKLEIKTKDVIHASTTIPSIFDDQQVETLHYAIQQPICAIESPPGCGKTEMISTLGLKIQSILKRQYELELTDEDDYCPVLVTGSNEVSLFNETGKFIFTRSHDALIICNHFSIKWIHDLTLRSTLLQTSMMNWITEHTESKLYAYICKIFPHYHRLNKSNRFNIAIKLQLLINDDSYMLQQLLPGIYNHYVNPFQPPTTLPQPMATQLDSLLSTLPQPTPQQQQLPLSKFSTLVTNTTSLPQVDSLLPTKLFNTQHFYERLALLFAQDELELSDEINGDISNNIVRDDDIEYTNNNHHNTKHTIFHMRLKTPVIKPLSQIETLQFFELYHELQLDFIRNSPVVCCTNETAGNKLLFHNVSFHHVLMDDTQSIPEPVSLLPLNYGVKQFIFSFDQASLHTIPPSMNPIARRLQLCRPLGERLLTLNDWQLYKDTNTNSSTTPQQNYKTVQIIPSARCHVQYRLHPKLFEYPYQAHYQNQYPKLQNQLTLPRDIHAKHYDVLFYSVSKKDFVDRNLDCPRTFGPKYFEWASKRLEVDRAGMYNRSLEKFPWPNESLPFLFLSTHGATDNMKRDKIKMVPLNNTTTTNNTTTLIEVEKPNTTNPTEVTYTDQLLAHFVRLGLNLDDLAIMTPFQDQVELMYETFSSSTSALYQALVERRLLPKQITPQLHFRTRLTITLPEYFQSVDTKIIVFSTVRSNSTTLSPSLTNDTLIMLAMTRARNAAMFLGDHVCLLQHSSAWAKLILYAARNNCLLLPTMAKRFVPWLAQSRSFIYDVNRRRREMTQLQLLPSLIPSSVVQGHNSSSSGSKDPHLAKESKIQIKEMEEFETLSLYYTQLLKERVTLWKDRTKHQLDVYDDGYTVEQNNTIIKNFALDCPSFTTTPSLQLTSLLLHFTTNNTKQPQQQSQQQPKQQQMAPAPQPIPQQQQQQQLLQSTITATKYPTSSSFSATSSAASLSPLSSSMLSGSTLSQNSTSRSPSPNTMGPQSAISPLMHNHNVLPLSPNPFQLQQLQQTLPMMSPISNPQQLQQQNPHVLTLPIPQHAVSTTTFHTHNLQNQFPHHNTMNPMNTTQSLPIPHRLSSDTIQSNIGTSQTTLSGPIPTSTNTNSLPTPSPNQSSSTPSLLPQAKALPQAQPLIRGGINGTNNNNGQPTTSSSTTTLQASVPTTSTQQQQQPTIPNGSQNNTNNNMQNVVAVQTGYLSPMGMGAMSHHNMQVATTTNSPGFDTQGQLTTTLTNNSQPNGTLSSPNTTTTTNTNGDQQQQPTFIDQNGHPTTTPNPMMMNPYMYQFMHGTNPQMMNNMTPQQQQLHQLGQNQTQPNEQQSQPRQQQQQFPQQTPGGLMPHQMMMTPQQMQLMNQQQPMMVDPNLLFLMAQQQQQQQHHQQQQQFPNQNNTTTTSNPNTNPSTTNTTTTNTTNPTTKTPNTTTTTTTITNPTNNGMVLNPNQMQMMPMQGYMGIPPPGLGMNPYGQYQPQMQYFQPGMVLPPNNTNMMMNPGMVVNGTTGSGQFDPNQQQQQQQNGFMMPQQFQPQFYQQPPGMFIPPPQQPGGMIPTPPPPQQQQLPQP